MAVVCPHSRAPVAPSQVVGADDEELVRVDGTARPDKPLPPACILVILWT